MLSPCCKAPLDVDAGAGGYNPYEGKVFCSKCFKELLEEVPKVIKRPIPSYSKRKNFIQRWFNI